MSRLFFLVMWLIHEDSVVITEGKFKNLSSIKDQRLEQKSRETREQLKNCETVTRELGLLYPQIF